MKKVTRILYVRITFFKLSISCDIYFVEEFICEMEKDPNFKFDVTLSHKGYDHKPTQVDYRTMQWVKRKLSINDFVALITEGYSYCHIYFGSRRSKEKFKQTQTVSIDVDEAEVPLKDFIEKCSPKPTFAYETFSNNNGKKKYRYRLVYIFNQPQTASIHGK